MLRDGISRRFRMKEKTRNIAVLISDVHFSVPTLKVASEALKQAVEKSNELDLPLIVCGDLHDTKANIRAECVTAIRDIFSLKTNQIPLVLVGNHDLVNEKGDDHALDFLRGCAILITQPTNFKNMVLMPYFNSPEKYIAAIDKVPKDKVVICHQGIHGALSGEYAHDKTAVSAELLQGRRIISGHYHTRQQIQLKDGLWDYVGNPYTLNFAEHKDPEKGYQILKSDGTLEFVPTNLRRHRLIEIQVSDIGSLASTPVDPRDILKIKISGSGDELAKVSRKNLEKLLKNINFSVEFIRTDKQKAVPKATINRINEIIDSLDNVTEARKTKLKSMWESFK